MESKPIDADSLLWNWARWCWSGEAVGNMALHHFQDDDRRPINHGQALLVEKMYRSLPHHEGMVITAEYPQKNAMFAELGTKARQEAGRRWIGEATGIWLTEYEYKLYLGLFKDAVRRNLL